MKTLCALFFLSLCSIAQAGSLIDVQVLDQSTGQLLPTWRHQGQLYVAGTPGHRYAVRVVNRTGGRVLSVVSVDGVNAVSGQTAQTAQAGYVLDAGQATEIAGWRKSLDEVAAFYFTRLPDSYAARTDRPENVGVIGVAVFREFLPPRLERRALPDLSSNEVASESAGASRATASDSAAAKSKALREQAQSEPKLGTGHGERLTARVETTTFRRASDSAAEMISIYYDSRQNLMARGIIPPPRFSAPLPNAFPGGFAPDPKS